MKYVENWEGAQITLFTIYLNKEEFSPGEFFLGGRLVLV